MKSEGLGFAEAVELRTGDTVIHGGQVRTIVAVEHKGRDWPYFRFADHDGSQLGNWISWQICGRDPIRLPCQHCCVGPGEKCKNYKGQNKQTCPDRGKPAPPAAAPEPDLFS